MKRTITQYQLSGRLAGVIWDGMEEVLGGDAIYQLLEQSRSEDPGFMFAHGMALTYDSLGKLQQALVHRYGPLAGPGLIRRIGRASFTSLLKEFGEEYHLTKVEFRMLPPVSKIPQGLAILGNLVNKEGSSKSKIVDEEDSLSWQIERCPFCWNLTINSPACQMAVGLVEEALYWLSNGKLFLVREENCLASGGESCTIVFSKQPID